MKIKLKPNETLVLRTCDADGTSRNDFRWPKRGPVKCPDWNPYPKCGNGLHGALMGKGDSSLFNWSKDALWQVVKVKKDKIVQLDGKVKFPYGYVVFTGSQKQATDIICAHGGVEVIGAMRTAENKTIVVGGRGSAMSTEVEGVAKAGDYGIAVAGFYGNSVAGKLGIAITKGMGSASVENGGIAVARTDGKATAGSGGISISQSFGVSTVGDCRGKAISGDNGKSIAGNEASAETGVNGKACAGVNGKIQIDFYDGFRMRTLVGYIGEDGLEANVFYKVVDGKFMKA